MNSIQEEVPQTETSPLCTDPQGAPHLHQQSRWGKEGSCSSLGVEEEQCLVPDRQSKQTGNLVKICIKIEEELTNNAAAVCVVFTFTKQFR